MAGTTSPIDVATALPMRRVSRPVVSPVGSSPPRSSPSTNEASGSAPRSGGSVPDLIRADFPAWAVSTALCVGWRESHYDPFAQNPHSSAGGVFQWVVSSWLSASRDAGWSGHSRFEAAANVGVAAWWVAHRGWSPWAGGSPSCGI
jgi:hypothetical protein